METIRACDHCNGEVIEVSAGDEGLSVCQDCNSIEGGDSEVTIEEFERMQS